MTTFLTTTFSPMMLTAGVKALVEEVSLEAVKSELAGSAWTSAVGHATTAPVLTALLGTEVSFNRVNLALIKGTVVLVVTPNFRADVAREFTFEEVSAAGFRCFRVEGV